MQRAVPSHAPRAHEGSATSGSRGGAMLSAGPYGFVAQHRCNVRHQNAIQGQCETGHERSRVACTGAISARKTRACDLAMRACGMPDVFVHGVASGDPLSDAIVLWTHVTTDAGGDEDV